MRSVKILGGKAKARVGFGVDHKSSPVPCRWDSLLDT